MLNKLLKLGCLACYLLGLAGLAGALTGQPGLSAQRVAVAMLLVHVLELVLALKYVRLYRGSLLASIGLTLLFGLLHWRPLAQEQARAQAQAASTGAGA